MLTVLLLIVSNVFMTLAWYGHLKWFGKDSGRGWAGLSLIVLLSWGIAFFEYCFQVPANRLGKNLYGLNTYELKTIQEVITLVVFAVFAMTFLKESLRWNYVVGFALIAAGAVFVFKPWAPAALTP